MTLLRASQVVERFSGLSYRMLQHWRLRGLLVPSFRTPGGHWRYTQRDLRRLRILRVLHASGCSTRLAKRYLDRMHREVESMIEVAKAETAAVSLARTLSRT